MDSNFGLNFNYDFYFFLFKFKYKDFNAKNGSFKKDIKVNSRVNTLEVLQDVDLVSSSSKSIIILK